MDTGDTCEGECIGSRDIGIDDLGAVRHGVANMPFKTTTYNNV